MLLKESVYVGVCVRASENERSCERRREKERAGACVGVIERESAHAPERASACRSVCVCERENESTCERTRTNIRVCIYMYKCERTRENARACACVCVCACVREGEYQHAARP